MFQIGFSEILLIVIVGVIFLKPQDYPLIAKKIQKAFNQFTKFKKQIHNEFAEIKQELEIDDLKEQIKINEFISSSKIIGDDGEEYETFEMPEIMPDIKKKPKLHKKTK